MDYKPILDYYLKSNNRQKVEEYTGMMLQEQEILKKNLLVAMSSLKAEL
jgi:hypothetical protein